MLLASLKLNLVSVLFYSPSLLSLESIAVRSPAKAETTISSEKNLICTTEQLTEDLPRIAVRKKLITLTFAKKKYLKEEGNASLALP